VNTALAVVSQNLNKERGQEINLLLRNAADQMQATSSRQSLATSDRLDNGVEEGIKLMDPREALLDKGYHITRTRLQGLVLFVSLAILLTETLRSDPRANGKLHPNPS
jgi:hypothetical protein